MRAPRIMPPACLAAVLAACAHTGGGLSRRAEGHLPAGERAYLLEGDRDSAEQDLSLAAGAGSARASFLLADLLDLTGRPEEALPLYVSTLEIAGGSGTDEAEAVAAAMGLVAIRGRVRDPGSRLGGLAERLRRRGARLPGEVWHQLGNLAFAYDRMSGAPDAARESLERTGCLTSFEVTGPIGPRTWEAFDRAGAAAPDRIDSHGQRVDARTCAVRAFPDTRPEPGAFVARTGVFLERPSEVLFRLETTAAARIRIGSAPVHESDTREGWLPTVRWFRVPMPAGTATITVEIASHVSAPSFSLTALDAAGRPAFAFHDPGLAAAVPAVPERAARPLPPPPGGPLAMLRTALWWNDHERAAGILDSLAGLAPVLLAVEAELARSDPSLPGEEGFERAGRLLEAALDEEPRLWHARSHLALQWAADDRGAEAMSLLAEGMEHTPDEPGIHERFAQIAMELDWPHELALGVAELERLRPGSCESLAWRRAVARRSGDASKAMELARRMALCDVTSDSLASELERARRFDEALEERRRLSRMFPKSAWTALGEARAAAAAGAGADLRDAARRAIEAAPADGAARWLLADALLAAGDTEGAEEVLERAAATRGLGPGARDLFAGMAGAPLLGGLRVDGPATVAHYLDADPGYDTDSVWVLDRAVHVAGDDGSRTELVHTIAHLRTAGAVEDHGELALPPGARLLTARTIKADGSILEPERVAMKDTISLPDLVPGDFVESEYVIHHPPSPLHPGGFDTERFFFQDFSTAFHRSEMILVLPDGMDVLFDPRGGCPAPVERRLGRLRAITWRVRGVLPLAPEPMSPWVEEFLPSIRAVAGAEPGDLAARLRELLAEGDRAGRRLEAFARGITRDLDPWDEEAALRACYGWVMNNVEEVWDLLEQPVHTLERRSGSRLRALQGLLGALGIESRLVLVSPADADDTPTPAPSMALIGRQALLLPGRGWISTEQEGAPFGYLPPDLRHRPAIMVDDGSETRTDGGAVPVDTQRLSLEVEIAADGSARGRVLERMRGSLAAGWRADLRRLSGAVRAERFQERHLATTIPGARLVSLEVEGLDDIEADLTLSWSFEAPAFARRSADGIAATLPFEITLVRRLGGLARRATPAVVASRIARHLEATVTLPAGYAVEGPAAREAAGEWGSVARRVEIEGNRMLVEVEAELDAGRVPPESYPRLLDFAREMDGASRVTLTARPAP